MARRPPYDAGTFRRAKIERPPDVPKRIVQFLLSQEGPKPPEPPEPPIGDPFFLNDQPHDPLLTYTWLSGRTWPAGAAYTWMTNN